MRWSDGEPVTADDWLFWYEDMYSNEELVPNKSAVSGINGKQGTFEKVMTTRSDGPLKTLIISSLVFWQAEPTLVAARQTEV